MPEREFTICGAATRWRTGEAGSGVVRLMEADAPAVFDPLKAAVRRANRSGETRFYPGSPLLIADAFRARDHLVACELRPDDFAAAEGGATATGGSRGASQRWLGGGAGPVADGGAAARGGRSAL